MADPIYTIEGDTHRVTFPGGGALEGLRPQLDPAGRLWTRMTAVFPNGNLAHRARLDVLNQHDVERFHQTASQMDGTFQIDWRSRLLFFQTQVLRTLEEGVDEERGLHTRDDAECCLPFPVEVLPSPLAHFVETCAKALPCPQDFIAIPMLSVLGSAIGTSRVVQLKPGWFESARLWTAVIADPGSKKSPAIDLVMQPLYAAQRQLQKEYANSFDEYEAQQADYEKALAAWKRDKQARSGDRPTPPEEPGFPQVFSTDATVEAMASVLEKNPRGLLFVRDELAAWARAMNQYRSGKGADRQCWLSFWNGATCLINRKSRKEPVVLHHPFVAVAGCMPPDVLGDLSDEQGREDGFVHRILFAFPEAQPLYWAEESISADVQQGYAAVVEELSSLAPDRTDSESPRPRIVATTGPGHAAFVEWAKSHYMECNSSELPPPLHGPWSKLEGYCARLALVLQMTRLACGEVHREAVDDDSILRAAALIDYFKSHARRVYERLHSSPQERRMAAACEWIARHGGEATARDIYTYKVAGCHTQRAAEELLSAMRDSGLGRLCEEQPPGGGHRRKIFRLDVHAYSALGTRC